MPADQHIHSEEEFLNESWDQMSALLDKEMPINQRPKPPGKSWLTAILVLLFAWTTYLYWPVQNTSSPIETDSNQAIQKEEPVEPVAHKGIIESKTTRSNLISKNEVKKSADQAQFATAIAQTRKKLSNNYTTNPIAVTKPQASEINIGVIDYGNQNSTNTILIKENEKLTQQNFEKLNAFDQLPAKDLESLEIDLIESTMTLAKFEDNLPKWTIGVNYEMIFDRRLRSGRYVGMHVKRKLSDQFSVQAGLGLTEYQKLNPAENSFEASSGMPVRYDYYDDQKVSIIGINSLTYLSVPLELVFQIRKKWSVIAGLGFSYMLDAEFTKGQNDETWQSHADGTIINSENALLGSALQRFDVAPSIGFTFRPTKRIGMDLKFRNGILDISKDKFLGFNEFHSNRYLHLGVSYDLAKF